LVLSGVRRILPLVVPGDGSTNTSILSSHLSFFLFSNYQ
jgi:hypothetical protein